MNSVNSENRPLCVIFSTLFRRRDQSPLQKPLSSPCCFRSQLRLMQFQYFYQWVPKQSTSFVSRIVSRRIVQLLKQTKESKNRQQNLNKNFLRKPPLY